MGTAREKEEERGTREVFVEPDLFFFYVSPKPGRVRTDPYLVPCPPLDLGLC